MKRFNNACKAEWTRVFTTRSWWILGLVMVLYVAFTAGLMGGLIAFVGSDEAGFPEGFDQGAMLRMIYALGPTLAYLFPVLIGALSVTAEYRHHTLGSAFIWSGSRGAVLGGKVTVQMVLGMFYGVAALAAAVLASVFFFMAKGMGTGLGDADTWWMFLRATIAMGLWAVVGVGVGILVRNQAAAIVIVIVFTQFVEPMARMAGALNEHIASIVAYLPGAASDAFTGASFYTAISAGGYDGLTWWAGGLILAGYAALLVGIGAVTRWRSDVG